MKIQHVTETPGTDKSNPGFLQIELEGLSELMGIDISDCGIPTSAEQLADPNAEIKFADEVSILKRLLRDIEDPAEFAFLVASRLTTADRGIVGLGMMSAPTLEKALDFCVNSFKTRFKTKFKTDFANSTSKGRALRTDSHLSFEWQEQCNDQMVDRFLTDRSAVAIGILLSEIAHFEAGDLKILLRNSKPRNSQLLHILAGGIVSFDEEVSAIRISNTALKQNLPYSNQRTFETCEKYFRDFPEMHANSNMSDLIQSIIRKDCNLSLEKVADEIGITSRTLHRRLQSEGTSFRNIVEEVKTAKAKCMLEEGVSVKAVAIEMGYADQSSFSRAFSRWCGKSPSSIRPS